MSTKLIKNKQRGASLDSLNSQMRMFVLELIAGVTWKPVDAARKAKYKNPSQAAYRLLNDPRIQAALGKAQREREERCELKGDDVLEFLRAGLFLNPLRYFRPTKGGKWSIINPDALPEEVGRLIESMEVRVVEHDDGSTESCFVVSLVSKAVLLGHALKHLGLTPDRVQATIEDKTINWDSLVDGGEVIDVVEEVIEAEASAPKLIEGNGKKRSE